MLRETLHRYQDALRLWLPLLSVHLFIRLLITAAIVPVIGGLLALSLSFSDQSALTDQDIARFLLTPVGAFSGLVVVSLVIVAAVLDVAVMTALLQNSALRPIKSLQLAARFALNALPILLRFAMAFLLRILIISAPFLIVCALIAGVLLREFDINYYLTHRPPTFLAAVGLSSCILLVMAIVLLGRLTSWAIALHLAVLDTIPVRQSFADSAKMMHGHRFALLRRLFWWIAIRAVIAGFIGLLAGFAVDFVTTGQADNLKRTVLGLVAVGITWSAASVFINALSSGALAHVLNDQFQRALNGRQLSARHSYSDTVSLFAPANVVLALTVILSLTSIGAGGLLLESFEAKKDVVVIGHRGAAGSRPENTMASIEKAIEDQADWVEIDVQETADGEIIVAHDSDFMKAADVPTKIWDATREEIAQIDIGSWYAPEYSNERAPLLSDVLATAKGRAKVIIELKYYGHDVDLENRVIQLVEAAGMADQISTMSLKYPAVQKMQELRPGWRTGVLAATAVGDLVGLQGDFLAVNTGLATTSLISRADAAGKDVYVWTVNDAAGMSRMISLGVDGLITDEPALAREVIEYRSSLPTAGRLLLAVGDWVGMAFDFDAQAPADLRP